MHYINKVDIIGNDITFRNGGEKTYTSFLGGLFSIILFILTPIILVIFGLPMVEKTNTKITFSKSYQQQTHLNMTNHFPIMATVVKKAGLIIADSPTIYNIQFVSYEIRQVNKTAMRTIKNLNSGPCTENDFDGNLNSYVSNLSSSKLTNYICLKQDQNIDIFGTIGSSPFKYLGILINSWVNSTNSNITCKSQSDINAALQNVFLTIQFPDHYFDSNNYTDPGQFYPHQYAFPISSTFYKRIYLYYKNVDFSTDDGIILEKFKTKSFYQIDSTNIDIYPSGGAAFYPNTISEITLTITQLKDIYKRNYYKIQNLAADMGGIYKTFLLIFVFINNLVQAKYINTDVVSSLKICNLGTIKKENSFDAKNRSTHELKAVSNNKTSIIRANQVVADRIEENKALNQNYLNFTKIPINIKEASLVKEKLLDVRISYWDIICFFRLNQKKKQKIDLSKLILNNGLDIRSFMKRMNNLEITTMLLEANPAYSHYYQNIVLGDW